MIAQEIRGGLQVDPFACRAWHSEAGGEWVVEWWTNSADFPEQVGLASFKETDDGIDWQRFYVREPFQDAGIYSTIARWSVALDVKVTATGNGLEAEGFKLNKDGTLNKRTAKAKS